MKLFVAEVDTSTGMGHQSTFIDAYVIGESEQDCIEKFVRQRLGYDGENPHKRFKQWSEEKCGYFSEVGKVIQ